MARPDDPPILLHAVPRVRLVEMGGPDLVDVRHRVSEELSALLGRPPGLVLTSACSTALEAAASLLALRPGDEVVVPAFTFPTSITPFLERGATIRFADVSAATGNIDPASAADKVGERTRALVVVHYAGLAAPMDELDPLLDDDIDLIEDAAHGLFARSGGRPLGRTGRFGALSFHATKNISSIEGGALVVNRADDLERAHVAVDKGTDRAAFEEGRTAAYDWQGPGSAWRMPEGAVRYLEAELQRAEEIQRRRTEVWQRYTHELRIWAEGAGVGLPVVPADGESPAHLWFLVLPSAADRPDFVAHCAERGIQAVRHYGSMASAPYGRTICRPEDACPVADDLALRLVRLPLHHELSERDVDRVVDAVRTWLPSRRR